MAECIEITRCLAEEYALLRRKSAVLRSMTAGATEKRAAAEELLPLLKAHTLAEEETLLSSALEAEPLRLLATKALEHHELLESELLRLWQSADEEQFRARASVAGDLLDYQLGEMEESFFPYFRGLVNKSEREELGMKYQEAKARHQLAPVLRLRSSAVAAGEAGKVGYLLAWLLGVPAWLLLLILLVRG